MTGQRALDETGGLLASDERLSNARCAIIGGGLAGASLTELLKAHGVGQVTLIDKGRALGGRLSARQLEGHCYELGATRISPEPGAWIEGIISRFKGAGLSYEAREAMELSRPGELSVMGRCLRGGLEQLVTLQAQRADRIERSARVLRAQREGREWWLFGEQYLADSSGQLSPQEQSWGPFDQLTISAPSPQAAQLLFPHRPDWARAALKVRYKPQWVLCARFEEPLTRLPDHLPTQGVISSLREALPVETDGARGHAWVIQADHRWTEERLERSAEEVSAQLLEALSSLYEAPLPSVTILRVHRWRYASPLVGTAQPIGPLYDPHLRLSICGDWTLGGHGGWAYESAARLSSQLLESLS